MNHIEPGTQLDGYELIRPIGEGGFGQVWMCRATFTGEFKALKIVRASSTGEMAREFQGLVAYREKAPWVKSAALMPVEHANALPSGFFYVMPLADGLSEGISPEDADWKPKSLATWLHSFMESGVWLNSEWIHFLMLHLIHAAQALEGVGLIHRDHCCPAISRTGSIG